MSRCHWWLSDWAAGAAGTREPARCWFSN